MHSQELVLAVVFWTSFALILYVYVGYPTLIWLYSRVRSRPVRHAVITPEITVIIPAHNEEPWIRRKVENTLALQYPRDRMQIVVASDGSTDGTVGIAGQFAWQGVEVAHFADRAGKTATLNRAVARARGEILVFTDANALLEPDAFQWLISHFGDPEVGGVSGERTCLASSSTSTDGEGLYWRYEAWIKRSESRVHSCLGAYGQLFAVRRQLFPYVRAVSDDFCIPMKILVSTGARILFEPRAKARIPAASTLRQEWERKVRSHVALLYDISHLREGLNPLRSPIWWQLWSHHVLRMFVPWAMLAVTAVTPWLWIAGPIYRSLAYAQVMFYLAAATGFLFLRRGIRWKPFYQCFYFVFANVAVGAAWLRCVRSGNPYKWQRTERQLPPVPYTERPRDLSS